MTAVDVKHTSQNKNPELQNNLIANGTNATPRFGFQLDTTDGPDGGNKGTDSQRQPGTLYGKPMP
jgi:hypothetical protein